MSEQAPSAPALQKRQRVVHLYHHTHWDREWWSTFQRFRFRLVHTIDRLLEVLQADPGFGPFVLDGQTIVLKDYLEARPERREELVGFIRAGRIHVGPWHVLPDEFLVSAEAHVRNLLLGERVARELGVELSRVGYLPDQFGHVGQMPQILRGFGIESAVVWRGFGAPPLGGEEGDAEAGVNFYDFPRARNKAVFPERMQSEFWWEAPDGSRVLGIYLPLEYYRSHYKVFPSDPERTHDQTVGRARRTVDYLERYAATDFILEPMGGDHLPVDERLPGLLEAINAQVEGFEYRMSSLEAFVADVKTQLGRVGVVWRGEGRAFGRKAHLLPGVFSARMHLKQKNRDAQAALERYAEPLQALNWLLGGCYEHNYLWLGWEKLIQNHPHDSICGCSTDQVHREMIPRFDEAQQIADLLAYSAQEEIAARVDYGPLPERAQPFTVFNPLSWTRTDAVRLLLNAHLRVEPQTWALKDAQGNELPFQARTVVHPLEKAEAFGWLGVPSQPPHRTDEFTEVSFVAREVPGLGYRAYRLEPRAEPVSHFRLRPYTLSETVARDKGNWETTDLAMGIGRMENAYLEVTVSPKDGSLTLRDKETGHVYEGLGVFEDGGDAGDTYNYSFPIGDQVLSTRDVPPRLSWVELGSSRSTLRVTWPWSLPAGLSEDRNSRSPDYVPFELHSDVTLHAGVKRVDVRTHFTNTARDHRLRALFPLGRAVKVSSAEGHFHVVERPVGLPEGERGSGEPAVHEHPQQTFVSVSDGTRGLTVANRGLPEFSVSERGEVALTLLRAVGWLSREDFLSRVGGAGPTAATPEAQMLGPVVAEYSLIPHAGTWAEARSYRAAHDFNAPLSAVPAISQVVPLRNRHLPLTNELPPAGQFVALEGDLLLSALKKAERSEHLILRFVNLSARPAEARLHFHLPMLRAFRANLREELGEELRLEEGTLRLEAGPWEVLTLALEPERARGER